MRMLVLAAAALLVPALPLLAADAPAAVPTGLWQVDFAEQRCVALRTYNIGKQFMIFAIEPDADGAGLRVLVKLPKATPAFGNQIRFEPAKLFLDGQSVSEGSSIWPAAGGGVLLTTGARETDEKKISLATLREVEFRSRRVSPKIALPTSGRLTDLLRECNRDLLKSWGFALADQDRLATWPKPVPNLAGLVKDKDYPRSAVAQGQQGEVRARLAIDTGGKVSSCIVRDSSGWPLLDEATCNIISKRARFQPALDKSGRPMAAPSFTSIKWLMAVQ